MNFGWGHLCPEPLMSQGIKTSNDWVLRDDLGLIRKLEVLAIYGCKSFKNSYNEKKVVSILFKKSQGFIFKNR